MKIELMSRKKFDEIEKEFIFGSKVDKNNNIIYQIKHKNRKMWAEWSFDNINESALRNLMISKGKKIADEIIAAGELGNYVWSFMLSHCENIKELTKNKRVPQKYEIIFPGT